MHKRVTLKRTARFWSVLACTTCIVLVLGGQCGTPMPVDQTTSTLVFTNLNAALLSITGTSASNVYTVGADPGDGQGPYILHYDGAAWERLDSGASGDLWWISVTPIAGDYFMVGAGGLVLSFDPGSGAFTQYTTPGGDEATVFGVWGSGGSSIWAVGGDLNNEDDGGFVWRYDGSQWNVEDLSAAIPEGLPTLYKVWGRSANDIYTVGRLGLVLHYDGTSWSQITTDTTRTLFTVHGNGTDVIAVGGFGDAVIEELEGDAFVNRAGQSVLQLNGVFVPGTGDAVAAGNEGTIVRRTVGGWESEPTSFDTPWNFHGAWVDPEGGIWAVGGNLSAQLDEGILAYVGTREISSNVSP